MPKPRKRNSLLALALKQPKTRTFHMTLDGGYYQQRITLPDGTEAHLREYRDGSIETVPILPITLDMLGLKRLPSGRIIPK